jgi:hypothetical protein
MQSEPHFFEEPSATQIVFSEELGRPLTFITNGSLANITLDDQVVAINVERYQLLDNWLRVTSPYYITEDGILPLDTLRGMPLFAAAPNMHAVDSAHRNRLNVEQWPVSYEEPHLLIEPVTGAIFSRREAFLFGLQLDASRLDLFYPSAINNGTLYWPVFETESLQQRSATEANSYSELVDNFSKDVTSFQETLLLGSSIVVGLFCICCCLAGAIATNASSEYETASDEDGDYHDKVDYNEMNQEYSQSIRNNSKRKDVEFDPTLSISATPLPEHKEMY